MNAFITIAGFATALEDISGEVTAATVTEAIKAMPDAELPGSGGLTFRCGGEAVPQAPAVCTSGGLITVLDGSGVPEAYEIVGQDQS